MSLVRALLLSILVHGVLALALVWYGRDADEATVSVALDLSSVDFSFAEKADDAVSSAESASVPSEPAKQLPMPSVEPVPERRLEMAQPVVAPVDRLPDPVLAPVLPEVPPVKTVEPPPVKTVEPPVKTVEPPPVTAPSQPVAAKRQAKVDAPPRPKRTIHPDYPTDARRRGEQGTVLVEFHVTEAGRVDEASVAQSSGYPELDAAALRAVRAASFVPARSGARAVDARARLSLTFKLK